MVFAAQFVVMTHYSYRWLAMILTGWLMLNSASANEPAAANRSMNLLRKTTLALLQEGNERYVSGALKHPHTDAAQRSATALEGQDPYVTVLACSDSRAPAELIFDRGIGEIFTIRVAGNVADTDEIATIEYGVGHLHTPLVVVMGHTRCGAVTAVVQGAELHGLLPQLVDNIKPAVESSRQTGGDEKTVLANAIKANVWQAVADVLRRSSIVRTELAAGNVSVVGAVYDLETGGVEWLGEHPDQKKIIEAYKVESKPVAVPTRAPAPGIHGPPAEPVPPAVTTAPVASAAQADGGHAAHGH